MVWLFVGLGCAFICGCGVFDGFGGLIVLCLLISLFCIHFDYLVCWFGLVLI